MSPPLWCGVCGAAIQRGQARLFPAVEGYVHELASPYSEVRGMQHRARPGQSRTSEEADPVRCGVAVRARQVVDRNGHKGGFTVTLSDDLLCWWQADEDGGA